MNYFKDSLQIDENGDYNVKGFLRFIDKDFCIIDAFKYKDIKYFYIVEDKEKEIKDAGGIENYKEEILVLYIYEKEPGMYASVTDKELLNELDLYFLNRLAQGKIIKND